MAFLTVPPLGSFENDNGGSLFRAAAAGMQFTRGGPNKGVTLQYDLTTYYGTPDAAAAALNSAINANPGMIYRNCQVLPAQYDAITGVPVSWGWLAIQVNLTAI